MIDHMVRSNEMHICICTNIVSPIYQMRVNIDRSVRTSMI